MKLMGINLLPLYILIALTLLGAGISMAEHGKSRAKESFWTHLVSISITWTLIYWMIAPVL